MKDKCFIFYANPCITCITDPGIQNFDDARQQGPAPCRYFPEQGNCSTAEFGCIQRAGAAMARHVLQFYSAATDSTLDMERDVFRSMGPLPPQDVKAYIDTPEFEYRRVTDPDLVVQRVWEVARAALDLQPGDRVLRDPEETFQPPAGIEAELERAATDATHLQATA